MLLLSGLSVPSPALSTQVNTSTPTAIQIDALVSPPKRLDYEKDVLLPLREAQAKAAEEARIAAQKAEEARLEAIRARQVSYGSNDYTAGQCTWYVASRTRVPSSMGNATNWEYGLRNAGWHYGVSVGAIGVSHNGWAGHVVYVEAVNGSQVLISEMNYFGPFVRSTRVAGIGEFVYLSE